MEKVPEAALRTLGVGHWTVAESRLRMPFDDEMCAVVEEVKPEVVSFHFGLPRPNLVDRLKTHGVIMLSSATSVREAEWLESRSGDGIIAQGLRGRRTPRHVS